MNKFNTISEAIEDLKNGKIIIVVDDIHRENEGDFVLAAQHANQEKINLLISVGKGLICAPLDLARAQQLKLQPMVENNVDTFKTAFTVSVDAVGTTTGISADERALTLRMLAQPQRQPEDFKRPGHIFPLIAQRGGVLVRPGHTEASVDLMKLAQLEPVAVICEILNQDGTMARRNDLFQLAKQLQMTIITIEDLKSYIQGGHQDGKNSYHRFRV